MSPTSLMLVIIPIHVKTSLMLFHEINSLMDFRGSISISIFIMICIRPGLLVVPMSEKPTYDNIDNICKHVNKKQRKYFDLCIRLANNSSIVHKHGCVIVNNQTGNVIGSGYNKQSSNTHVSSIHAEMDAIKSVKKNMLLHNRCDMYIVRIGRNDNYEFKYSKPCEECTEIIKRKTNIKHVYYSVNC